MPDRFPLFEVLLKKRGRKWRWRVCTVKGKAIMLGSECSRPAAKYQAHRALFLLLLTAPYRLSQRIALQDRDLPEQPAGPLGPIDTLD